MLRRFVPRRIGEPRPAADATVTNRRELNPLYGFFLVMLLLLYWVYALYLERVDLTGFLTPYWNAILPMLPLPGWLVGLTSLFHPRVLRHFIPVIVGWWLAHQAAMHLMQTLYDLPSKAAAQQFLRQLLSSQPPFTRPVLVSSRSFEVDREKPEAVLLRIGGPGRVRILPDNVAVTELNGRFHRVLRSGMHRLERLEVIYAVLDLRSQERSVTDIALTTADGITLQADLSITFRIDTGEEPATQINPYPYDPEAVRLAVYAQTKQPDDHIDGWDTVPVKTARRQLMNIVGKYGLDEILYPNSEASEPYLTIKNELMRQTRHLLNNRGIELIDIRISRLELGDQVREQYIQYWQSHLDTQIRLHEADGEAASLELMEIARAEAEVTMIQAIIEGVQRAEQANIPSTMQEIVALRLIEALEKIARQSGEMHSLPPYLLPQLTSLREEIKVDPPSLMVPETGNSSEN